MINGNYKQMKSACNRTFKIKINKIIDDIIDDINKNKSGQTSRKYNKFFGDLGMLKKRDFDKLQLIDKLLKKKRITLWRGKEQLQSLRDFRKKDTLMFRLEKQNKIFKLLGKLFRLAENLKLLIELFC